MIAKLPASVLSAPYEEKSEPGGGLESSRPHSCKVAGLVLEFKSVEWQAPFFFSASSCGHPHTEIGHWPPSVPPGPRVDAVYISA